MALTGKAAEFLALHTPGKPLLQPNAFDAGSARILASLGFKAIATTSSGFALTQGHLDGQMSPDDVLAHCTELSGAVVIPVAADTENGFADDPVGVAEFVARAAETGLAGCSVEDWSGSAIYDVALSTDRITAAAEAAHAGPNHLVLTSRAENLIRGVDDLAATIARLQAYQAAGADVLFAPGVRDVGMIKAITSSVDAPVNVLVGPGAPPLADVAAAGAARISVGGWFAYTAYTALIDAAAELRDAGTYEFGLRAAASRQAINTALAR